MNPTPDLGLPAELESLLGELVAGTAGTHPNSGQLLAYQAGRLRAEDEAAVQRHLATCPACSALLLDLDAFTAAGSERDALPADLSTATAWRAFAPRLATPARRTEVPPWLRAVAASLLVAVPVLALLLARSHRQIAELRDTLAAPQVGVPMLYLDSVTRDEELDGATLELPAGDSFFLDAVTPAPETAAERYRVEVVNEVGKVAWRDEAVVPSDHGTLRLGFTRRTLPPGRYHLEVTDGGKAEPRTVFSFVLRDPA